MNAPMLSPANIFSMSSLLPQTPFHAPHTSPNRAAAATIEKHTHPSLSLSPAPSTNQFKDDDTEPPTVTGDSDDYGDDDGDGSDDDGDDDDRRARRMLRGVGGRN